MRPQLWPQRRSAAGGIRCESGAGGDNHEALHDGAEWIRITRVTSAIVKCLHESRMEQQIHYALVIFEWGFSYSYNNIESLNGTK